MAKRSSRNPGPGPGPGPARSPTRPAMNRARSVPSSACLHPSPIGGQVGPGDGTGDAYASGDKHEVSGGAGSRDIKPTRPRPVAGGQSDARVAFEVAGVGHVDCIIGEAQS